MERATKRLKKEVPENDISQGHKEREREKGERNHILRSYPKFSRMALRPRFPTLNFPWHTFPWRHDIKSARSNF